MKERIEAKATAQAINMLFFGEVGKVANLQIIYINFIFF